MQIPAQFPFHATVRWPAQNGGLDLMVNVYAESSEALALRYEETVTLFAQIGAVAVARTERASEAFAAAIPQAEARRQAAKPVASAPTYHPEDNPEDNDDWPDCFHGESNWLRSKFRPGDYYMPGCMCEIKKGRMVARREQAAR